jgi:hypothetical protein
LSETLHTPASPLDAAPNAQLEQMVSGSKGHESALAGQISARGEHPGTYWMLSFGLGFDEARASLRRAGQRREGCGNRQSLPALSG